MCCSSTTRGFRATKGAATSSDRSRSRARSTSCCASWSEPTPFRRRIRGDRSDHERHVKFTARPSATLLTYRAKQPWPLTSRGSIRPPRRAAPVVWNALKAGAGGFTCADARSAGTSGAATIRQANMRRRTTTRRGIQLSRVLSRRKTGSTTFGRKCSSTVPYWLPRCHILFINPCQGRRVASRTTGSRGSTEHPPPVTNAVFPANSGVIWPPPQLPACRLTSATGARPVRYRAHRRRRRDGRRAGLDRPRCSPRSTGR